MSQTWQRETPPPADVSTTAGGVVRAVLRGVPLAITTFGCLALLLLVRLIERPIFGARRPITPHITQFVCRMAFIWLGMGYRVEGRPDPNVVAVVANHSCWLDIFALNAPQRIYFVSKAEVAGWPGIGWLARATGTVFIERRRSEAARHTGMLAERMAMGHRLMVFPEGTSTDGQRVLPFRPTLLAAFMGEDAPEGARIQPVTVIYEAPDGAPHDFYGWWGDMSFDRHLLNVLMVRRPGSVRVIFHPAVAVGTDRKALARSLRDAVAAPMEQAV